MFIETIRIENFRNFEKLESSFYKGLNIITGSNNSGKSNLLKAIDLIYHQDRLEIDDFNKNNLKKFYKCFYKTTQAPYVKITYQIHHDICEDNTDDESILKLISFLGLDKIIPIKKDKYLVIANVEMKFSLKQKHLADYKQLVENCVAFDEYINALQSALEYFEWTYSNATTGFEVNKKEVTGIFDVELIDANRNFDEIPNKVKNTIRNYLLNSDKTKQRELDKKISDMLQESVKEVLISIDELIKEEKNEIGIKDGNIAINQGLKYKASISEAYNIDLIDTQSDYIVPLTHNGLGYNNLIAMYMLLKIPEITRINTTATESNKYKILCIEEPEAHLHPAMQYKLFSYLKILNEQDELKQQIFISTHSPNITAVAGLDSIISLHYHRNGINEVIPVSLKKQFEKNDLAKKHLMKFLDVTKSDMLFANLVILVEGITEKLLLPLLMKRIDEKYDYANNHISIVEIGGKNFKYFLQTFVDDGVGKKVLCVTDKDYMFTYTVKDPVTKAKITVLKDLSEYQKHSPEHIEHFKDRANVKYVIQKNYGRTFEDELFIDNYDNYDVATCLLKIALPQTLYKYIENNKLSIDDWNANRDKIDGRSADKIIEIMELYLLAITQHPTQKLLYEKLFFAALFHEYVQGNKGDVALSILVDEDLSYKIITPKYIEEGIKWILSK